MVGSGWWAFFYRPNRPKVFPMAKEVLLRGCENAMASLVFGLDRDLRLKNFARRSGRRYSCFEVVGEFDESASCEPDTSLEPEPPALQIDSDDLGGDSSAVGVDRLTQPAVDVSTVHLGPLDGARTPVFSSGRSGRKKESSSLENGGGLALSVSTVRRRG